MPKGRICIYNIKRNLSPKLKRKPKRKSKNKNDDSLIQVCDCHWLPAPPSARSNSRLCPLNAKRVFHHRALCSATAPFPPHRPGSRVPPFAIRPTPPLKSPALHISPSHFKPPTTLPFPLNHTCPFPFKCRLPILSSPQRRLPPHAPTSPSHKCAVPPPRTPFPSQFPHTTHHS